MGENIAIFGVTGALGREVLAALEVEQDGIGRFFPVAGVRSAGQTVAWRGAQMPVGAPQGVNPSEVDVAVLACPPAVVRREAARLVKAGARVVDTSGALSRPPLPPGLGAETTVAWPQLTPGAEPFAGSAAISLPSPIASTIAPVLEALTLAARPPAGLLPALVSVDIVAVKAASSAGREGATGLSTQAVSLLNYQPVLDPAPFPTGLAFNVFAEAPEDALFDEATAAGELVQLLPSLRSVPIGVQTLWAGAFSGLALSVTLRFSSAPAIETLMAALVAHPDLEPAASTLPDDDEEDGDDAGDDTPQGGDDGVPGDGVVALRDALDADPVRFQRPTLGPDGAVRLVLMADPLHRTAVACQKLVSIWLDADEASDA